MYGGTAHLDLHASQTGDDTSHGSPTHTAKLVNTTCLPLFAPQRQAALLWIIAHLVCYRLQSNRRLNHKKFMDFLRGARWKAYHRSSNRPNTGRYLYLLWRPTMVPVSVIRRPVGRDQQECTARHGPRLHHVLEPQTTFSYLLLNSLFSQPAGVCHLCTITNGK